ncbi:transporter [Rhizobium sp. YS-1r]|uniref:transporter n=1 Tax=Rhizobium sp. YS-1r TaxID=1532558 RepID=UPI001AEBBE80|nr:transporter [Rhizobium sp. YS-1r]
MNSGMSGHSPFVNRKYSGGELAFISLFFLFVSFPCGNAAAQATADDRSQKLANPPANLTRVPLQNNVDFGAGVNGHGFAYTLNIQPVMPLELTEDWNLITRTIIPIGYRDYLPGADVSGLGDVNASFFFSPKGPGPGGLIRGAGPVALLPTATDDFLGAGIFGLGSTAVGLVQQGPWMVGALANHIWSIAGPNDRPDVSVNLLPPFASHNFGGGRSVSLSVDANHDGNNEQRIVPVNFGGSQIFTLGFQAMSSQIGGRYYAGVPSDSPEWGRTTLAFLFPK